MKAGRKGKWNDRMEHDKGTTERGIKAGREKKK